MRKINDEKIITQKMLEHINTWPKKPVEIKLDELSKKELSMMIQPLAGIQKSKQYINGSYIGQWTFAVYYRLTKKDTKAKLDARKLLEDLDEWFNMKDTSGGYLNLPILDGKNTAFSIEMASTPSIAEAYDDGTEDYQAIFNLNYKHKEA